MTRRGWTRGSDARRPGRPQRRVRWASSLQASALLAPCARHGQNQLRHLFGLIQLDEVLGARDQEEFGPREELVERPGDAAVQGRVGVAEDDPDRPPEL